MFPTRTTRDMRPRVATSALVWGIGSLLALLMLVVAWKPAATGSVWLPAQSGKSGGIREHWPTYGPQHYSLPLMRRRAALSRALGLGLGSRAAASTLLGGRVAKPWQGEISSTPVPTLQWPVPSGWFVRGYGSGEGGYHLAVDIQAPRGDPIHVAAPGLVGYAGNAVRGYGNLIMVIHDGGLVTAYAHNQRNLVVAGERVQRNAVIALVGSTGISRGPHLHFELMANGRNCDPLPLFRPAIRRRSQRAAPPRQATWRDKRPPSGVRCARRRRHPRSRWYARRPPAAGAGSQP